MNDNKHIEDEVDFKDVARRPIRWFGLIYPAAIFLLVVGGLYYVSSLNVIYTNGTDLAVKSKLPEDLPQVIGSVTAGVDLKVVTSPTEKAIARGKELFVSTCASCHGTEGKGDGPASTALNPKPRNFHAKEGWTNGREFSKMYKTLQEGIIKNGMAAYEFLPPSDRIDLILYIRSITGDFPPVTDSEIADLDNTYQLSKGAMTPNQIPVAKAMTILEADAAKEMEKVDKILAMQKDNKNDQGSVIFEKVSSDPRRALLTLIHDPKWKTGVEYFVSLAAADTPQNGFKPDVSRLDQEQAAALYQYLTTVVNY